MYITDRTRHTAAEVTYHGGKSNLFRYIKYYIEKAGHVHCFCEPFVGGGAIIHNLPNYPVMVINDTLDILINFYQVAKNRPEELLNEVDCLLHAQSTHKQAKEKLKSQDELDRAVAFFVLVNSLNHQITACFAFSNKRCFAQNFLAQKRKLTRLCQKMQRYTIMNTDAIDVIEKFDGENTLFYLDPPYPGTGQGHYRGFSQNDFDNLLDILKDIKGRFILSCYARNISNYKMFKSYKIIELKSTLVRHKATKRKNRIKHEFIGCNFEIDNGELF